MKTHFFKYKPILKPARATCLKPCCAATCWKTENINLKELKKGTKKVRITLLTYKEQKQNRFHHITELKGGSSVTVMIK